MLSLCNRGISLSHTFQKARWKVSQLPLAIRQEFCPQKLSCHVVQWHRAAVAAYTPMMRNCPVFQPKNIKNELLIQNNVETNGPTVLARSYRSTNRQRKDREKKQSDPESTESLESLLNDKSLSFFAKFKVLFRQYGIVLVVVHSITAVFWFSLFYYCVSRGFNIVPYLEKYGVFTFLEKIGLPASDKLKSPGASNALAAYLLYEVAKPIRYPVTVIGTVYAVRFLRRLGHLKAPPKAETTVRELVQTQGKIAHRKLRSTATKYRDKYKARRLQSTGKKTKTNGNKQHHRKD